MNKIIVALFLSLAISIAGITSAQAIYFCYAIQKENCPKCPLYFLRMGNNGTLRLEKVHPKRAKFSADKSLLTLDGKKHKLTSEITLIKGFRMKLYDGE